MPRGVYISWKCIHMGKTYHMNKVMDIWNISMHTELKFDDASNYIL